LLWAAASHMHAVSQASREGLSASGQGEASEGRRRRAWLATRGSPAVTSLKLPRCGADFLVCSDGVWDALPAEAVLATVRGMMRSPVTLAASAIVESALNQRHAYDCDGYRRPRDDTTALLLRVRRSDEAEVLPAGGCLGCS